MALEFFMKTIELNRWAKGLRQENQQRVKENVKLGDYANAETYELRTYHDRGLEALEQLVAKHESKIKELELEGTAFKTKEGEDVESIAQLQKQLSDRVASHRSLEETVSFLCQENEKLSKDLAAQTSKATAASSLEERVTSLLEEKIQSEVTISEKNDFINALKKKCKDALREGLDVASEWGKSAYKALYPDTLYEFERRHDYFTDLYLSSKLGHAPPSPLIDSDAGDSEDDAADEEAADEAAEDTPAT